MPTTLSRRRALSVLGSAALAGSAGCLGMAGAEDGDLVVRNEDATGHAVTAIGDRGADAASDPWVCADWIEARTLRRFDGAIPGSDWNYPFLLHVSVDGDYVRTTEHRRDDEIVVRVQSAGEITATESEHTVPIEPTVRADARRTETDRNETER